MHETLSEMKHDQKLAYKPTLLGKRAKFSCDGTHARGGRAASLACQLQVMKCQAQADAYSVDDSSKWGREANAGR